MLRAGRHPRTVRPVPSLPSSGVLTLATSREQGYPFLVTCQTKIPKSETKTLSVWFVFLDPMLCSQV